MFDPNDPQQAQTLTDHLSELRDRLIWSAWAILAGGILCWIFSERLFDIVRAPIVPYLDGGGLVFTSPMDKFASHMKLAFAGGVILACPMWIYQVWRFVAPGLHSHEKKYSAMFILSGTVLFLTGVSFSYFLVLPTALEFLLTFGGTVDKPLITIGEYLSFFTKMILVFGAAFEMPLIIVLLGIFGIVNQAFLRSFRRYAVVILAVISAIITPPDAISMLMLLIPMMALYELSIILVGFFGSRRSVPNE